MFHRKIFVLLLIALAASAALGQGTVTQRVDVMRNKIDSVRRSLSTMLNVIRDENKNDPAKKDDKDKPDTPLGRLTSLDKESSRIFGDINNLRGKLDRGEKYDASEVDS